MVAELQSRIQTRGSCESFERNSQNWPWPESKADEAHSLSLKDPEQTPSRWMNYSLEFCNAGDLYHRIKGQTPHLNRLPRRFWILDEFRGIHLVHSLEVVHIL